MTAGRMGIWTAEHVRRIVPASAVAVIPGIMASDRLALDADRLYWDMWPVQDAAGHRVLIAGRDLWMALTAPDRGDPGLRHFEAKIHWIEWLDGRWHDRGPVLPDGDAPYEREWAGSALCVDGVVSLFFTAAGSAARGGGYQQQLLSLIHISEPTRPY